MDLVQIQHLTDEQKERYKALPQVFELPGWAIIKKWAELNHDESRDRGASASTWEMNRIAFGERIVYDVVRKMEDITELEYSSLAKENAASAAPDEEVDDDDLLSFER